MLLLKFADKQAMSVFASTGLHGSVNKFPNAYDSSDQALELITLSIFSSSRLTSYFQSFKQNNQIHQEKWIMSFQTIFPITLGFLQQIIKESTDALSLQTIQLQAIIVRGKSGFFPPLLSNIFSCSQLDRLLKKLLYFCATCLLLSISTYLRVDIKCQERSWGKEGKRFKVHFVKKGLTDC